MKIGILSDIHANRTAFEAVLADIADQDIKGIIYLGDLVSKGPSPVEVIDQLQSLGPLVWLKGNTELWLEEVSLDWNPKTDREKYLYELYKYMKKGLSEDTISFLLNLPLEDKIRVRNRDIFCFHGSPESPEGVMDDTIDENKLKKLISGLETDLILVGHSHRPYLGKINGKLIINAGSVGSPYDGDVRASYILLEITKDRVEAEIRRVEYDIEKELQIARENKLPFYERYAACLRTASPQ